MTNELPPIEADGWGFPIEACQRCAGQGRIPVYSNVFGGTCFGCNGKGKCYPTRAIKALAGEHAAWLRQRREVSLCSRLQLATGERTTYVAPGDTIREWGGGTPVVWRTVAAVKVLPDICGMSLTGAAADEVRALVQRVRVTFTDGSSVRGFGETWIRRVPSDEVGAHLAPLVERAVAGYMRTLARRRRPSRENS